MVFLHGLGLNDKEEYILEKLRTHFRRGKTWWRHAKIHETKEDFFDRTLEELKNMLIDEIAEQEHNYYEHFSEAMDRLDEELQNTIGRKTILNKMQEKIMSSHRFQMLRDKEEIA